MRDYGRMTTSAVAVPRRTPARRHERSAGVLVRMSPEDRAALLAYAEREGTTATELLVAHVRQVTGRD